MACSPQSWAAGASFLLLQAALGLEVKAPERLVRLRHARLPPFLDEVKLTGLQVGDAELDLAVSRQPQGVVVSVTRKSGEVEVTLTP